VADITGIGYIPVKGAISCGDLYVDSENTLFFGEALIEAYEYGENHDWIGLLLCPSMEERFKGQKIPAGVRLNYASTFISFREHPKEQPGNFKNNLQACILGKWIFVNNQNPIIKKLNQMKQRLPDENIREMYDRAINFIQEYKTVFAS
jgi:hypothetical protein